MDGPPTQDKEAQVQSGTFIMVDSKLTLTPDLLAQNMQSHWQSHWYLFHHVLDNVQDIWSAR